MAGDTIIRGTADFSPCGRFRWTLTRTWGDGPIALVCGANPSDDDTDLIRAFPEAFEPYRMAIRIAELEAQIARLTAPITPDEAVAFTHDRLFTTAGGGGNMGALTAFLERRMKG